MASLTFRTADGASRTVTVTPGMSVMEAAVANSVPGIVAECGGSAMCATCHVYVDDAWLPHLPPVSPHEDSMLDFTESDRRPGSRLGCQVKMTAALDGLSVELPEEQ